jgi:hypothetical protein
MKSLFSNVHIGYAEYEYWRSLGDTEKLQYLFELHHMESFRNDYNSSINLNKFFENLNDELQKQDSFDTEMDPDNTQFEAYEFDLDAHDRVDVMIDDSNIMIESNNLKALRAVSYKFVEAGYILRRDVILEKVFKKDKVTKYLRIFRIINQVTDLCSN